MLNFNGGLSPAYLKWQFVTSQTSLPHIFVVSYISLLDRPSCSTCIYLIFLLNF